jgi:saccharopine dehydrogenase-like NADP-dependent oxidoreductase
MATTSNKRKPVIFIGATDAICGEAIRILADASNVPIVLADANKAALQRVADKLPGKDITLRTVDLFDPNGLREAIVNAALVVQGAQPYSRTSKPVLTACIDTKVPYLDYSDNVHSTQESLELHERAKTQGVPCYINCGASPGLTNLLASEIAQALDTVEALDICWLVGEESGKLGREVLEHLMDITGGSCLTWADKRQQFMRTGLRHRMPRLRMARTTCFMKTFIRSRSHCHVDSQM